MDVDSLRAITPGAAHRVHLNNAGAALMSQPTLDAMTVHLRLEAEIGGYEAAQDAIAATYEAIAELVGGAGSEVALFDNATHAWNAAFYSIPFRPGDRILTGRSEYGSNILAYLQNAQRSGAEVVVVPNDEYGQLDTRALVEMIDERTMLIGVSHVPTAGGLVNPAAEIGRIARDADVLYLLDATQSVGQFPVDAEALCADMITGTGRKFLRAPRGGAPAGPALSPLLQHGSGAGPGHRRPRRSPPRMNTRRRRTTAARTTKQASGHAPGPASVNRVPCPAPRGRPTHRSADDGRPYP